MNFEEKAIVAGVKFEAASPNDGRPPLFIWSRGDDSSAMGHETLRECARDACIELKL